MSPRGGGSSPSRSSKSLPPRDGSDLREHMPYGSLGSPARASSSTPRNRLEAEVAAVIYRRERGPSKDTDILAEIADLYKGSGADRQEVLQGAMERVDEAMPGRTERADEAAAPPLHEEAVSSSRGWKLTSNSRSNKIGALLSRWLQEEWAELGGCDGEAVDAEGRHASPVAMFREKRRAAARAAKAARAEAAAAAALAVQDSCDILVTDDVRLDRILKRCAKDGVHITQDQARQALQVEDGHVGRAVIRLRRVSLD